MSITIKLAKSENAAECLEIYSPSVLLTPTSFELDLPSEDEFKKRITDTLQTHPWLIAVVEGQIAGYAYACEHRSRKAYQWSVEVSAYVRDSFQGQGVGKALYQKLISILKAQNFCNAYAGITLPNTASVKLHESCGFKPIGIYKNVGFKMNAWHDVGWWQLRLIEDEVAPKSILSVPRSV